MNLTKSEYERLYQKKSPDSPLWKDMLWAGLIGGAICTVGQLVSNFYKGRGLDTDGAAAATAITMVFLGALLTGLHRLPSLAKKKGRGRSDSSLT